MEVFMGKQSLKMLHFEKICEILNDHNYQQNKLIPILREIQDEYRYLPEEVMTFVASSLDISPSKVFGVATFFEHFKLSPRGKYIIKICDGTACHVKGSMNLYKTIKEKIGLKDGNETTDDLLFTLETVSCLGACGLAPVMVINDKVYGQLTPEKTETIIEEIVQKEKK